MRFQLAVLSAVLALPACGAEAPLSGPASDSPPANARCSAESGPPAPERLDVAQLGRPTFDDEFNSFNRWNGVSGTWSTNFGYGGKFAYTLGKQEQLNVDTDFRGTGDAPLGLNPFSIRNGALVITADRAPKSFETVGWGYQYTSGAITTRSSFAQCHGYFEIRARLPRGRGLWPAFYLLPADGRWPPEIDVLEMLGHQPDLYYATTHWGPNASAGKTKAERREARRQKQKQSFPIAVPDTSADFHTYGVWWDSHDIVWYFDGAKAAQMPVPPGLDSPMFMIANMAVGGSWPGPPDANTPFPSTMTIDRIRAYRLPQAR